MKVKNFIIGHKKIFIAIGVIIVLLFGISRCTGGGSKYTPLAKSATTQIKKKDFSNTVTESGKVVSEESVDIYAEKNLPVKEVSVEVGDEVVAGQIIGKLDDSSIRQQIETKQALIGATNRSTNTQVKGATDKLNEAIKSKADGTNAQVVSANASILQAYDQWQSAEKTYSDYLRSLEEGYNEALVAKAGTDSTLDNNLNSQSLTYEQSIQKLNELNAETDNARRSYNEKVNQLEELRAEDDNLTRRINELNIQLSSVITNSTEINADTLSELEEVRRDLNNLTMQSTELKSEIATVEAEVNKYKTAVDTNDDAKLALEKEIDQQSQNLENIRNNIATQRKQDELSKKSREDMLKTYEKNAADAKNNYESAKKNLEVALAAQDSEIRALQSSVDQAKASGDNSVNSVDLKNLYEDLEKTVIKAPISGTVTRVDMKEGQVPTAALAQVQTVKRTVIESQVKEYDYPKLKVGMEVEITSDALGRSKVFKGKVESIDPTPKAADPQTQTQEVLYTSKISIEDPENELQPGMTTRVRYVLESEKNVIVVPTTAIYKKGDKNFVLVVDDGGVVTIREIEVKVKTGNDIESVIESSELNDKVRVINSAEQYQSGMEVELTEETEALQ